MIEFVFFDLDDTLLDFKKAERIALKKALKDFGYNADDKAAARYSEINISQWKLLELGILTREEVKVRRYELLFEELGLDLDAHKVTQAYENYLSQGHYFISGAQEIIERLSPIYRLYIVSNGASAVQESRIKSSGIEKYFNDIFISQNIGFDKPDARFFEHCFESIDGFEKERAVIIGDSLTSDIKGGINAGISTVWYNPRKATVGEIIPDYEINVLSQLPELLRKI